MTNAGSMTAVGTKYSFPWCCCLNLANKVSSVACGKLQKRKENNIQINGPLWQQKRNQETGRLQGDLLALLIQQVQQPRGLLADEVDTAHVVSVVDVVPGDALRLVFLLRDVIETII